MDRKNIEDYRSAQCPFEQETGLVFSAVHQVTNGRVCDTGCAQFNGGKCPAYQKLIIPSNDGAGQLPQETVRETANRLGISISEVRRRRKQATI